MKGNENLLSLKETGFPQINVRSGQSFAFFVSKQVLKTLTFVFSIMSPPSFFIIPTFHALKIFLQHVMWKCLLPPTLLLQLQLITLNYPHCVLFLHKNKSCKVKDPEFLIVKLGSCSRSFPVWSVSKLKKLLWSQCLKSETQI